MLDQDIDGALGSRVGGQQHANRGVRSERRKQYDTAAVAHDWQQLLYEEVRGAHVYCEERVEILDGGFLDTGCLRDTSVSDEDVQAVADNGAHAFGQRVRSIRCT